MAIYNPKRGTSISDSTIISSGKEHFSASIEDSYEETVHIKDGSVDGKKDVDGYVFDSGNPILKNIRIGIIDMGNRKDWLQINIEQAEGEALRELMQSAEPETLEEAATAKNRFIKDVTGYSVEDLKDKVEETAKGS